MKLSVIIPVYNAEPYIGACLHSLLAYAGEALEVLVVDDGSRDGSGNICDAVAASDLRVKVFHQANAGVSAARNLGLDQATGDWISFVDADDEVLEGYVEACISAVTESDVVFFAHEGYWLTAGSYCDRMALEQQVLYLKQNEQHFEFFGYTWNKFFRASIIQEHHLRFPSHLSHREDEYFTTEFLRYAKELEVLGAPLYRYRIDNNNAHLTHRPLSVSTMLQLSDVVEQQLAVWQVSEPLQRYEIYRALYMRLEALLMCGWMDVHSAWRVAGRIVPFVKGHHEQIDPQQYPYGFVSTSTSLLRLLLWWMKRKMARR